LFTFLKPKESITFNDNSIYACTIIESNKKQE